MKKKHNMLTKLLICWYWLFKHGDAIMVQCNMCNSTKLSFISTLDNGNLYQSSYECRSCGAVATNTEIWADKP
jgi:hypothetical protein